MGASSFCVFYRAELSHHQPEGLSATAQQIDTRQEALQIDAGLAVDGGLAAELTAGKVEKADRRGGFDGHTLHSRIGPSPQPTPLSIGHLDGEGAVAVVDDGEAGIGRVD